MAIYSVGRRRVIVALLLTTVLLLTLDLRGDNPVINAAREGFTLAMGPVESATGVVTNPIERVWHGVANYDDLEAENAALQDQVDRLIGTQAAAEAAVIEGRELQALYDLPSLAGIDTEVARVVGYAANNLDQVIEIDKGRSSGIDIGMAVVNQAGLVGRVTQVTDSTARVMLVTDDRYSVAVTVTSGAASESESDEEPTDTTPSGLTPAEVAEAGTTTTTVAPEPTLPNGLPDTGTTLPGAPAINPETGQVFTQAELDAIAAAVAAAAEEDDDTTEPSDTTDDDSDSDDDDTDADDADTTTTTTVAPVIEKEYGGLEGRGEQRLPQVRFVQNSPSHAELQVGDLVETAGGSTSLAPTGIPVGKVVNRADRPGSGGPLLDVELYADLSRLNFVRVVLYKPLSEVEQ